MKGFEIIPARGVYETALFLTVFEDVNDPYLNSKPKFSAQAIVIVISSSRLLNEKHWGRPSHKLQNHHLLCHLKKDKLPWLLSTNNMYNISFSWCNVF